MDNFLRLLTWLKERTAMSILPDQVLRAIAPILEPLSFQAKETIVETDQGIQGLYILEQGQVQSQGSCILF
jgi:hypothetical protein